jgi:hypothetical protein
LPSNKKTFNLDYDYDMVGPHDTINKMCPNIRVDFAIPDRSTAGGVMKFYCGSVAKA